MQINILVLDNTKIKNIYHLSILLLKAYSSLYKYNISKWEYLKIYLVCIKTWKFLAYLYTLVLN